MKNLLLLFTLISIISIGCKKDDDPIAPEISITGTWEVQSHKIDYYKIGTVDLSVDLTSDQDKPKEMEFFASECVITYNDGTIETSDYILSKKNGKNYIHFVNPSVSDIDQLEVSQSSSTTMQWFASLGPSNYEKGGQNYTSTKTELKVVFVKK